MGDNPDIQRMMGDVVRIGTVASVDHAKATCRVDVGDIKTGDLPWLAPRAGKVRLWSPPSVGEQVLLVCPEADTAAGIVLPGLFSNAHPAPLTDEHVVALVFSDEAKITYDFEGHSLQVELPDGGTVTVIAPGGVTIRADVAIEGDVSIKGDVTVTGKVAADDDVTAGSISLKNHTHPGVAAGGAKTQKPV